MNDKDLCTPPDMNFAYAYGRPSIEAQFRCEPEDFVVDEELGVEPDGEGEHLLLHVIKRGENTVWVAEQLAKHFKVRLMDIGYCGMKDRHALTSQWFSIYLPKTTGVEDTLHITQFAEQMAPSTLVLTHARHTKKLRRGQHSANRFQITLRALTDVNGIEKRLQQVQTAGVPNYFGEQRFGRNGSNLVWAKRWFEQGEILRSRNKKNMAKSAARSYLFNLVLAQRVQQGNWCSSEGDWATGPLWGRGRLKVEATLAALEESILVPWQAWLEQLEHVGLQQDRRALVLLPQRFEWQQNGDDLTLKFSLPPGAFATSVMRELVILKNMAVAAETVD